MKTHHCLRCGEQLIFAEEETLQLGSAGLITGILSNIIAGGLAVEIYVCPKCGKIEFFTPTSDIAKINCPSCNMAYDIDSARCPHCGEQNSCLS